MINKAIIVGNLGADPEVRYTPTGKQTSTFSVATTEKWKNQSGEPQESTEWHRVVAWERLAEICAEYLTKGARVYVEGKIQTRKWTDSSGVDRYTTEIICREMKMLSPPARDVGGSGQQQGVADRPPEQPPLPGYTGNDVPF